MTEQEYRQKPGVNKSSLVEMLRSPLHYRYALEHPREDTPAMKMGRAIHSAFLTPEQFVVDFAEAPACDRRTKEGRAIWEQFTQDNSGREILSAEEFTQALDIVQAL